MLYFAEKISPNMARSDEGYLICRNVAVARSGVQEYLPSELGLPDSPGRVPVFRPPEEVFSPACVASFEGKPVTEDHPDDPGGVTAGNIGLLQKGHAQNVRRGTGPEENLLLADLVITDPEVIRRVLAGKREISCGYTYTLAEEEGRYVQRDIRGNHIAIVDHGRAGPRVAIRDHRPAPEAGPGRVFTEPPKPVSNKERSLNPMNETRKNASPLIRKLVASAIRGNDLDPEDLPVVLELMGAAAEAGSETAVEAARAAAAEALQEAALPAENDPAAAGAETLLTAGDAEEEILARLDRIISLLEAFLTPAAADEDPPAAEGPADQLEEELGALLTEAGEAGVTPSEFLSAQAGAAEETALREALAGAAEEASEEAPGESRTSADAMIRSTVRALRPMIARLPGGERTAAADAALRLLRSCAAPSRRRAGDGRGYAALVRSARPADEGDLGRRIIASRNINARKG